VGFIFGLDAVTKKILHCACWELNSGRPSRNLVTILTELVRFVTCLACIPYFILQRISLTGLPLDLVSDEIVYECVSVCEWVSE
jgi:hypothetical protein